MKFYFCGSMTGDYSKAELYEKTIAYLDNFGDVLNKFVGSGVIENLSPQEEYIRDTKNLKIADILIADISIPSLGVGFEIATFEKYHKPMLFIYDNKLKMPSALIRGIPNATIKSYSNLENIQNIIEEFIKNVK